MGADGAPDDVQRVYYLWALQQDRTGFASTGGKHYPPRWQVRALLPRCSTSSCRHFSQLFVLTLRSI